MPRDRFWLRFSIIAFLALSFLSALIVWRVDFSAVRGATVFDTAPNPSVDPFEGKLSIGTSTPILYFNGLQKGITGSSWGSSVAWNATEPALNGSTFARVTFNELWSGVYIGMPQLPASEFQGITLALFAGSDMKELYLELYDTSGRTLGRQPLSWYYSGHVLNQNEWSEVTVPLKNLNASGALGGIALMSPSAGSVKIGALYFSKTLPQGTELSLAPPPPPDANGPKLTGTAALPYTAAIGPALSKEWYSEWGSFSLAPGTLSVGPGGQGSYAGSFAVFLNGLSWSAYHFSVLVNWGTGESISLTGRYVDDNNYVSCAFSQDGAYAQIYSMRNGKSLLLAETPELPVGYYSHTDEKKLGLEVQGTKVSCFAEDERVLSADVPDMPTHGTVGIETWAKYRDIVPHRIHTISVTAM